MILILPSQALVLNAYAVLIGSMPGSTAFAAHQAYIAGSATASGLTGSAAAAAGASAYKLALNDLFASQTTAALATTMLANLGLSTAFTQAQAEAFLTANAANRVGAMMDLASQLYIYSGTDAGLVAAKTGYVAKVDASYAYSAVTADTKVIAGPVTVGETYTLTVSIDKLTGTAFNDTFVARTINGVNSFNDGDFIDGGAGTDTVYLDFVSVGNAITPVLNNIESVVVRAQSAGTDANGNANAADGNNQLNSQTVQIDAQRSLAVDSSNKVTAAAGVVNWESSNSRSDVIIEDVRIGNDQKTKDVTITFRESDPGNVDFGVYFDQHSLRNSGSGTSVLTIQIMDTGAAAATGTSATPLLNNPYDTFKIGINGVLQSIALNTTAAPTTAASADTYAQLLAAFQAALLAGGSGATAALGADFTVIDPLSGKSVTGKSLVITGGAGITFSDAVAGAGWVNTTGAAVPNSSNIFTTFNTGATTVTELVTSKVILDDVGRGSTGGDLVIGGMSVGSSSLSRGVERFEITVEDSSKLQTINGTNNALREVTIVNGTTSNTTSAYNTVVANAGNLTVNGTVAEGSGFTADTALVGVNNARYTEHDTNGFTDVRLIDASAMTGSIAFTAGITSSSIAKYITQVDTAANPFADVAGTGNINFNVPGANFVYTGGVNNDTMTVTIDTAAVSSRSTVVSGMSDFTFNLDGGAGNDAITLTIEGAGLAGGAQAWYTNQKLNANITIMGGAGNDTVRTPGAGDVIMDLGDGNDTAYTDNTGALVATPNATGTAEMMAIAYANAAAAELAAGQAAAVASNTTGFALVDGTATGAAVTTATVSTALNTLNLATPAGTHAEVVAAGGAIPVHSVLIAAIDLATTSGALTFAQNSALQQAYGNWSTAGVVTPVSTMVAQTQTSGTVVADGTVVTAAQYDAGNALLETYIAAAKAAAATATAADALVAGGASYGRTAGIQAAELLNDTQIAVVNATQAVNAVFDPSVAAPGAGLTYAPVVTDGANEINTFTAVAMGVGETIIINGLTLTAAAGALAADVETALETSTTTGGAVVSGAYTAAWTVGAGGVGTVAYTSTATGDPTNLANTGTTVVAAPAVTAATTETVAMAIAGTGTTGETMTFGGVTYNVGGLTAAQVATAIDAGVDAAYTDVAAGAVVNFSGVTAGNIANMVAGDFVTTTVGSIAGTQTKVTNLAALKTALALGATDAAVVTALKAAINNGSISTTQAGTLFTAATAIGTNAMVAGDISAVELILTPLQTAAAIANTAAQTTLTTAVAADVTAVNALATTVAATPAGVGAAPAATDDMSGTTGTANAVTNANTALTAAQTTLSPLTTKATNLAALKSAISLGATDLAVVTATTTAVANGAISAADKTTIDTAAGAAVPVVGGTVVAAEKTAADLAITALQVANDVLVAAQTVVVANLQTVVTATTLAAAVATAAGASGASSLSFSAPKAVFVFNTSNQTATYNRVTMDDRNLADLKSDASNTYNFFNSTLKVTYKGIDASVVVAGTDFKTTDLQLNQAIKQAINTDAVLSKLLIATDGPANTLVVTSLIDGAQSLGNLALSVTMPTSAGASVAGAATAYGLAAGSTDAQVIAAMATAKVAFDTKGDYVTQWAESGAANGNVNLVGANSTSSSDNTITPGTGNDVIVLGTTASVIDMLSSSNETVVYSGLFGNDTIVNFAATGNGMDMLNLSALNGRGSAFGSLSADKSIVVGAPVATALTAAQIAALFTDSATAINHVYVAVDSTNIGSIWQVADAAGTAAGNVTATLVGSIDLADTAWASLTAANFV